MPKAWQQLHSSASQNRENLHRHRHVGVQNTEGVGEGDRETKGRVINSLWIFQYVGDPQEKHFSRPAYGLSLRLHHIIQRIEENSVTNGTRA